MATGRLPYVVLASTFVNAAGVTAALLLLHGGFPAAPRELLARLFRAGFPALLLPTDGSTWVVRGAGSSYPCSWRAAEWGRGRR